MGRISVLAQRTWKWSDSGHIMEESLLHTINPRSKGHIVIDLLSPGKAGSHWARGEASAQGPWGYVPHALHLDLAQCCRGQ